jgi:hypothetical protein
MESTPSPTSWCLNGSQHEVDACTQNTPDTAFAPRVYGTEDLNMVRAGYVTDVQLAAVLAEYLPISAGNYPVQRGFVIVIVIVIVIVALGKG